MRACLLFIAMAASLAAQSIPEVEITGEPHHRLLFQNAYVRVFQVEIAPGDATLFHHHGHDLVSVNLGTARISNQMKGNAPGSATLKDGQVASGERNMEHTVRNLGSTPFRNITVELLQDDAAHKSPPQKWDEERGLNILEKGTQDIVFVKDDVRVSEIELQPSGMIPQHRHVGPHLLIPVTDLDLQSDVAGKGAVKVELKAGEAKWVPGGFTHTLMNVGQQPAKFVTLEFH